jgi:predicted methyltransferase
MPLLTYTLCCRRRGELTGAVLSALADGEWSQLDLAGCRRLNAAEVLAVAGVMPGVRVLDVTGGRCCEQRYHMLVVEVEFLR